MDIDSILLSVVKICQNVGEFQLQHFQSIESANIKDKGLNQLVSFVDVESEKMLVSTLQKLIPEAGFITEENTIASEKDKQFQWIIDPLDGTTNYLHGLPAFSISVALAKDRIPILGVVHIPVWNETFSAIKNQGAFLNDARISVSQIPTLSESLIATGFPYYEFEYMEPYLKTLQIFMQNTHGLRRLGSAAIDLAYTACGKFEGFFELGLNPWDVAAGVLIVQEAGGTVSDFEGENNFIFGKSIIAANNTIYSEFYTTIKKQFPI